jgi:methylated-DNA-protein-cysteine methyltransferase-like protein
VVEEISFFEKVYAVVALIPHGRVTSYGGSSRMVGWAMNASHHMLQHIPAHRVVNRNGLLTGKHHFGAPDLMKQLLESEGITVVDDQVVNFNEIYWDPSRELEL